MKDWVWEVGGRIYRQGLTYAMLLCGAFRTPRRRGTKETVEYIDQQKETDKRNDTL